MRQYLAISAMALVFLSSCGSSKKDNDATLNDKKASLEKLKIEKNKQEEQIRQLEADISKLDTNAVNRSKVKLVNAATVATQNFQHFIDLQGIVDADNISYISPRGLPGQVKALYIKEGDFVKKGQLILKLDDAVNRQQIVASRQQLEGIKTQLAFAKNIYQRQKNLWDQGIGTEVQLITAKTNAESLQNQLNAAEEVVKVADEQLKTSNVYSDVTGIADDVNIRVGELFQGVGSTGPQIKIVNTSSLKVVTNVPENYAGRIQKGSVVNVLIPDINKNIKTNLSLISKSIDPTQRGFVAEAKIPYDASLKPNQLAVIKILDYAANNAVVIPVNVVQTDEKGKYVYVMGKLSNGKTIAQKKNIVIGEMYGQLVEVKSGLTPGEQIITEGFQNLYEGQLISTNVSLM
ncbi:MAG: efflux RND transporter periplasmic adaptor subunit [Ferruginibacter sp.]